VNLWFNNDCNLGSWQNNYNYWLWGMRAVESYRAFEWCSPNSSKLTTYSVRWQQGQPDNLGGEQRCLHARVLTNVSQIIVSDRNCSDIYVVACETKVTTPAPACDTPKCPAMNCTRDVKIFVFYNFK
jgi:hypothetical protein